MGRDVTFVISKCFFFVVPFQNFKFRSLFGLFKDLFSIS